MKCSRIFHLILGTIWVPLLIGCAGPSSPFGGLELGSGDGERVQYTGELNEGAVQFSPKRQVLHQANNLSLEFNTKNSRANIDLRVVYNDRDVTHAFQQYSSAPSSGEDKVKYLYEDLRLAPTKHHKIEFFFREDMKGAFSKVNYLPPTCSINEAKYISNTGPFSPSEVVIKAVQAKAKKYNVNPSFLFALIAQESGFDDTAVSSSRALGLTQVTPIAASEVEKSREQWRRYEKFDEASPSAIKDMIVNKKVTEKHDWRLDVERSIEGGLLYLQYLENYWALEENSAILKAQPKIEYGAVILASYNSGAARVKYQIQQANTKWLEQPKLKEAFRYVSTINSYCYHFSGEKL